MRRRAFVWGCVTGGLAALAGCHHEKYKVKVKHPEDFVVPPNETRFDNPPEEEYRGPIRKKDEPSAKDKAGKMNGPGQ